MELLWVLTVCLSLLCVTSGNPINDTERLIDCEPYGYCDGVRYSSQVEADGQMLACDVVPDPRLRCCLPQVRHNVCYNVMVDGKYLNYDSDAFVTSTDFLKLCDVLSNGNVSRAGISTAAGGGEIIYRYGEWKDVEPGSLHIKDLACEIL